MLSSWLVNYNDEEAIFRKPLSERVWYSAFLMCATIFLWMLIVFPYTGTTADREHLPLDCVMSFLVIFPLGFAAGPKEIHFDFRRGRYQGKIGFLFLSWTRTGDVIEISHISIWNLRKFTGVTVEWKNTKRAQTTLVRCETGSEAQALAERLGTSLDIPVKAGVVRGLKSTLE